MDSGFESEVEGEVEGEINYGVAQITTCLEVKQKQGFVQRRKGRRFQQQYQETSPLPQLNF